MQETLKKLSQELPVDIHQRRELLACQANPDGARDYLSVLSGKITNPAPVASSAYDIHIRYIPDRLILRPDGLNQYLHHMGKQDWGSLETLATTLLRDLQNEVIPRWVQVTAEITLSALDQLGHQITIVEDAQPGWHNDELLNRLGL